MVADILADGARGRRLQSIAAEAIEMYAEEHFYCQQHEGLIWELAETVARAGEQSPEFFGRPPS